MRININLTVTEAKGKDTRECELIWAMIEKETMTNMMKGQQDIRN